METPELQKTPTTRTRFRFGAGEQGILDAPAPVRFRHQQVELRGVRLGLLREGDRDHPDDLVVDAGDETEVE